jgi:uncharacterized protein YjdB
MNMKKYIGIMAGLLMLAGCANDDAITQQGVADGGVKKFTSFTATVGDVANTRAYLGNGPAEGSERVFWEEGDRITVYSNIEPYTQEFMAISCESNTAVFGGNEISGNEFYALYPAWNWELSDYNPTIWYFNLWGDDSPHGKNDFDFRAPMVAKSSDNILNFKQTTGMIHVRVGDIYSLDEVFIRGNNDERLGYRGYVDLSEDEPIFRIDETDGYNTTSGVWFDSDEPLSGGPIDIYFVIPPTTFKKGFTLEIRGYDEEENWVSYSKTTTQKLVVDRATVKHFTLVNVNAELEEQEAKTRAALKAFYDALGGDDWENHENWNTDAPLYQWYGLEVEDGILRRIDLRENNLTGAIPAAIADIPTLEWLELSHNAITAFPEGITLPRLRGILFGYNQIAGPLPESFANMPALQNLHLDNNQFVGEIPNSYFTNLTNLDVLLLNDNKLTGTITYELQATPMWQHATQKNVAHQQDGYGINIEGAVTEIHLNKYNLSLLIGEEAQLSVTAILPEEASNKGYEWGIGWMNGDWNDPIFSVDENGKVTALREGEGGVRVRAADNNGAEAYCQIHVVKQKFEGNTEYYYESDHDWDN